jgi:hypothetical protein
LLIALFNAVSSSSSSSISSDELSSLSGSISDFFLPKVQRKLPKDPLKNKWHF